MWPVLKCFMFNSASVLVFFSFISKGWLIKNYIICWISAFRFLCLRPSVLESPSMKAPRSSIGNGNTIVEFFSAEIALRVYMISYLLLLVLFAIILTCKYLSCNAAGDWAMTSAATFRAWLDFCSPSAAMTCDFAKSRLNT